MKNTFASLKDFLTKRDGELQQIARDFLHIDKSQLIRKQKYDERGRERGAQDLPPTDIGHLDEVERDIRSRFEGDIASNHQILSDELSTFTSRVSGLRLKQVPNLHGVVTEAIGDFRSEIDKGTNDLAPAKRHVKHSQNGFEKFRRDHRRDNPAMYPKSGVNQFAFIVALMGIETVLNGILIGGGAQGGLIEGFAISTGIASINILALGYFLGKAYSWTHYIYMPKKLFFGISMIFVELALVITLNYGFAHYRDAIQNVQLPIDEASAIALERVISFSLPADLNSIFLFAVGVICSVLAGFKWLNMDDPYPKYGKISRKFDLDQSVYRDQMKSVLDRLGALYAEAQKLFFQLKEDLEHKETEYKSVLGARSRKTADFKSAQAYNLSVAQQVVEIYRDENRKSRNSPVPQHFNDELPITIPPMESVGAGELSIAEVERLIEQVVQRLEKGIDELDQAWKDAQNNFENLQQITESGSDQ